MKTKTLEEAEKALAIALDALKLARFSLNLRSCNFCAGRVQSLQREEAGAYAFDCSLLQAIQQAERYFA